MMPYTKKGFDMYSSTAPSKFLKRKKKQVPRKARRKNVAKQNNVAKAAKVLIEAHFKALNESTKPVYRCSTRPRNSFTVFGLKFDDSQWNESVEVPDGYELVIRKYFIVRKYDGSEKEAATSQEIIVATRRIMNEPVIL